MLPIKELKRFTLFRHIADNFLDEIANELVVKTYSKGQIIYKRNKNTTRQYFLLEGCVNLIDGQYALTRIEAGAPASKTAINVQADQSAVVESASATLFYIENTFLESVLTSSKLSANAEVDTGMHSAVLHVETTDQWVSQFLESPLFSQLPVTRVQELFKCFKSLSLGAGDTVMREGESGDYFYVVASGEVRLTNRIGTLNLTFGPGQYFGEEALLGNTLRNATVKMTKAGALKRLDAKDFASLVKASVIHYVDTRLLASLDKSYQLLDVKMPLEFREQHVTGCINIPLTRLRAMLPSLSDSLIYAVADDGSGRAEIAVYFLCQAGYDAVVLRNALRAAS